MAHEGSEITALNFQGQTRKLHVEHLGTMGRVHETIYLENGLPVWVTRVQTTYDAPLSGRDVKRDEEWLYFQDGRLIQRDFMPRNLAIRPKRRREGWIHQTFIASPTQARQWRIKAIEWRDRAREYERELKAKQ